MPQPITMTYRNWRGEVAERTIIPGHIWLGTTEWHPQPGYLLNAIDVEKGEARDFALADCQFADLRVPAPAVPDDVATCGRCGKTTGYDCGCEDWQIADHYRGELATACATIEAQAAELARKDAVIRQADEAIAYYLRYLNGGEMRGSYDGKPERNALVKAGYATRAALTHPTGEQK